MTDLLSMSFEELAAFVRAMGQPAFRAKQLYEWLNRGAAFDQMLNLPGTLRETLKADCTCNPVSIERSLKSNLDDTRKFLFRLEGGDLIEGVLMHYHHGATLCLSTQVGCRMGCRFCASTLDGCVRNLTPGEMLGQVLLANAELQGANAVEEHTRVNHVVLMGSGEPLDNYDNVVKFIRLLTDERGLNLSMRSVSLSTCGLLPQLRRFADEELSVTLSLSLHAPNDQIRKQLMPIANTYSIDETLLGCKYYIQRTGRRVIIEYALIEGVNCELEHADELSRRLRGMQCHVNLIPLNAVPESALRPPQRDKVARFLEQLTLRHISATIRREMGDDIQGACGQLRRSALPSRTLPIVE